MEDPFGGAGAVEAACLFCIEARAPAGGLPGGVVDASAAAGQVSQRAAGFGEGNVLGGGAAFSFSRKDSSIGAGKVWPLSHMSRSFLIFSYTADKAVSYWVYMTESARDPRHGKARPRPRWSHR